MLARVFFGPGSLSLVQKPPKKPHSQGRVENDQGGGQIEARGWKRRVWGGPSRGPRLRKEKVKTTRPDLQTMPRDGPKAPPRRQGHPASPQPTCALRSRCEVRKTTEKCKCFLNLKGFLPDLVWGGLCFDPVQAPIWPCKGPKQTPQGL